MLCTFTLFSPLFKCYFFLHWKDGIDVRFRRNPVRLSSPSPSSSNVSIQSIFLRTLFEYGSERLNRRAFQKESGATFVALGFFFQRFDSEHLSSHIVISTLLQSILFVLLVCLKRYMFLFSLVS